MRFRFQLRPIKQIVPWGDGDDQMLHWFGLTYGNYWIETPVGEALRYTEQQSKLWDCTSPYVDYQVSRLFEDVQLVLPSALEPVTADIATIVAEEDWFKRFEQRIAWTEEGDVKRRLSYDALEWYTCDRSLDTIYLVSGPDFHFWRTDDIVTCRWARTRSTAGTVWLNPKGQFEISADAFRAAAHRLLDGVIEAMQERVDWIVANGWQREDCKLDLPLLIKEQKNRTAQVAEYKQRSATTDWDRVRHLLNLLAWPGF